jgi:hypothetical protein
MNFKESTDFSKVSKAHEIMLKCKEYIVLPGNNHDELVKIFDAISLAKGDKNETDE